MTLSFKHAFVSAKGDPADTTLVRPSDWNAEHTITMAANKVVGRAGSSGSAQELDFSPLAQTLAAITTTEDFIAALGIVLPPEPETGDVFQSLRSSAPSGWIKFDDGTIGDGSSGATTRANVDCEDLYTLIWNGVSDTYAPVSGGRGANAAADWAAHKPIQLLKACGRALAVAGAGSGLTSRSLGVAVGAETHTLTEAEMPEHEHTGTTSSDGAHTHTYDKGTPTSQNPGWDDTLSTLIKINVASANTGSGGAHTHTFTTTAAGSDDAHNNMQPTLFLNTFIKL